MQALETKAVSSRCRLAEACFGASRHREETQGAVLASRQGFLPVFVFSVSNFLLGFILHRGKGFYRFLLEQDAISWLCVLCGFARAPPVWQ
jgi:hypothetical protein